MPKKFSYEPHAPKYRQVFENLSREILSGKYTPGQKFPSEAALVQQYRTSRITVGRALRELAQRGLVERIAGSGTYVRRPRTPGDGLLFGLLIPDLGQTEIFEPICQGIAGAPQAARHALLWGHHDPAHASPEEQALALCDQFIGRGVSGVFFAPLELSPAALETNLTIVSRLEKARIPIVLLDRCVMPYPERSAHDLVGIDNRRAAYMAAEHCCAWVRRRYRSWRTPGARLQWKRARRAFARRCGRVANRSAGAFAGWTRSQRRAQACLPISAAKATDLFARTTARRGN